MGPDPVVRSTFLRNHARAIVACDFFVAVTSTFRVLYVLVIIEHHSRRLVHYGVTAHPSAQWTRQQLRDAIGYERRYEYLIHDRDSIFSADLDESIQRLGLRVLKSPPANSTVPLPPWRHRLDDFRSIHAKAILGGLHHEYLLARA